MTSSIVFFIFLAAALGVRLWAGFAFRDLLDREPNLRLNLSRTAV